MSEVKEGCHVSQNVSTIIDSLKVQIADDRRAYIKKKVEENRKKLRGITDHAFNSSLCTKKASLDSMVSDADLLARRQEDALAMLSGLDISCGQKDNSLREEESSNASSSFLFGNNIVGKNCTRPIKLPEISKLPPYTTWIFLDRNQRMAEDQSVLGRRRIYYDQRCGEALICSDSEEDIADDEEEKKVFGKVEDYILRMTIQEAGLFDDVLEALTQCLGGNPSEIKERYEVLISREDPENCSEKRESESCFKAGNINLDKDLDAAVESFDNLFCRRCLVFDCRLHGCSQDLVYPVEKQLPFSYSGDGSPCGLHCYKLASKVESTTVVNSQTPRASGDLTPSSSSAGLNHSPKKKSKSRSNQSESASSNAKVGSESSDSESQPQHSSALNSKLTTKGGLRKKNKRSAENVLMCMYKKQKKAAASESDSVASGFTETRESKLRSNTCSDNHDANSSSRNKNLKPIIGRKSRQNNLKSIDVKNKSNDETSKETLAAKGDELARKEFVDENICQPENGHKLWMDLEKSLFAKGVEIFGKNSCFIARNLLSGMKTCMDVFQYMTSLDRRGASGTNDGSDSPVDGNDKGKDRARSRLLRRRGKVRRLKYTWKSTSCHSIRKRITEKKDQPCRQYNPCGCQTACGKQCPCLLNGTCCEKYCGCPKICKNQFRGCHCAKSQCRSRQCPCFAADRECDPDVCRNCWIGCGDGTFGGPNQRGDNYECRNMKLLLRQQQRVLLGRSDISGWGAFVKNSVAKHEYLGEYTGELISHKEADKRGKIYDRENSSFLFNLNDQFVLDAYRKGDKLKFANHSPDPNCYAKVIMVAGDHRVGIFAKERISAGEELFYDYRYEADRAPAWARKPDAQGSKKVDTNYQTTGRAKKLA